MIIHSYMMRISYEIIAVWYDVKFVRVVGASASVANDDTY